MSLMVLLCINCSSCWMDRATVRKAEAVNAKSFFNSTPFSIALWSYFATHVFRGHQSHQIPGCEIDILSKVFVEPSTSCYFLSELLIVVIPVRACREMCLISPSAQHTSGLLFVYFQVKSFLNTTRNCFTIVLENAQPHALLLNF